MEPVLLQWTLGQTRTLSRISIAIHEIIAIPFRGLLFKSRVFSRPLSHIKEVLKAMLQSRDGREIWDMGPFSLAVLYTDMMYRELFWSIDISSS
jgi:hypothetical protein